MVPKRKTVPYATVDETRDRPFTRDLQFASLFVLAQARRKGEPFSAMTRVYYPLHIHSWEGGVLLIDLLGLNYTSIGYRFIPDVDEFERILDAASDDPDAFQDALKKKGASFDKFAGQKTVKIKGLITQRGKSEELHEFLGGICDFEPVDEPAVFKPVLNRGDIESIIDSIHSLRDDVNGDLKSLEQAKRSLMRGLDSVRKAMREEIQNIWDRSAEVKAQMRKAFEETKGRRRKALELDLKKIRKTYGGKADPIRRERTSLKSRLARRRSKLDLLKAAKDESAVEALSREIEELDAKFNEADSAIKSLEAWRNAEVAKARAQYRADITSEEDKIREETARSRDEAQKRRKDISELEAEAKSVATRIDKLIRSKKLKLRSLSRLRFDMEVETADLFIPFYIFQYGEKFEFYPPVVASGARGFISRFKRILAENLQSKMSQLIKPRSAFVEKYLAKGVRALSRDRSLATMYQQQGDRLNLLRSHEAVDKIMIGLVKIRREGWISDGEYIRLQETIVENLGLISRP